jgi:ABC-type multidrug transport system fused ATPase/permease subunit
MTASTANPSDVSATDGLLGWMLQYLRPYRGRVAVLSVLLVSEIVLGALQPWPLAVVIDQVLGGKPFPAWAARWIPEATREHQFALLVFVVVAGVILQVVNQFVSAYGTQVQVDTG